MQYSLSTYVNNIEIYLATKYNIKSLIKHFVISEYKYLKKDYGLEDLVLVATDIASVLSAIAVSAVAAESLVVEEVPMPFSCLPFAINAFAEINSVATVPAVAASLAPIVFYWVPQVDADAKIKQILLCLNRCASTQYKSIIRLL